MPQADRQSARRLNLAALLDRLLAHDPALSRMKMGARVTLTVAVSIATLITIHLALFPLPPISYALAIVLSIEGGVAVRDATPAAQLRTRMMGGAASLFCITLAAVLEDNRIVADLAFLFIILLASLARVYGPRGFAIGMFAFISYFIGAYLRPSLGQLPLAALGPLLAIVFGHLIRTRLLPDDWLTDLMKALRAMRRRVADILRRLEQLSRAGTVTERDRLEIRRMEEQLKDVVLMAESLLPRDPQAAGGAGDDPVMRLSTKIFDLHLAAEGAIVRSLRKPPPLGVVRAAIESDRAQAERVADEALAAAGEGAAADETRQSIRALLWLKRAGDDLDQALDETAISGLRQAGAAQAPLSAARPDLSWSNPLVRAAVQITVASGIAMVFGLLLSRERWFWAVLTAFLVFNNTRSRGDAAIRAVQRSVGTLVGIVFGLGLATVLAGHTAPTVALAAAGVFLAFYFLHVSYAVMSFFVTIVLCLVYGLIGQLTTDVLLLRLEETMIGSAAGMFVAFVLFPSSTRSTVELALARWYDSLGQLLDALRDGESRYRLIELANRLDADYRDLTIAARPLGSAWSLVTRPGPIRQTLAVFLSATYWARSFARDVADAGRLDDPALRQAITAARQAVDAAAARGADCFIAGRQAHAAKFTAPAPGQGVTVGAEMLAMLLDRLYPAGKDGVRNQ